MAQDGEAGLDERVLRALSTVTDPELDEPITDLGFVRDISITEDSRVSVDIVTSTFWCSPNFVYMMLEDARDVLSKLPGVREARVNLGGHHDAERINEGINSRKSFSECYGSEANGDLDELNRMFRLKALHSRLHGMAAALAKYGITVEELLTLTRGDIVVQGETLLVKSRDRVVRVVEQEDARGVARYLRFLEGLGRKDGPLVIWDLAGNPPEGDELVSLLSRSRSARLNLGLNAELCRALLSARMGEGSHL